MHKIEKNVENKLKHTLEENKVYIVVNGQLECIDIPEGGFGDVLIEWRYNQINMVKQSSHFSRKYYDTKHENSTNR